MHVRLIHGLNVLFLDREAIHRSHFFLPRALLKGPKRRFVVIVVLVVGVESSSKNFQNGTKIVLGNKKCS